MGESESKFKLKRSTSVKDLMDGNVEFIPTSDLCIEAAGQIMQFDFIEGEEKVEKTIIRPGVYTILATQMGLKLEPTELSLGNILETIVNTTRIKGEANTFFSRLHVYEKRNKPKKRSILLYSAPGMSKTTSIKKTIMDLMKEDPGVVALVWPTSEVKPESVQKLLSFAAEYDPTCTKLILVAEDIGGAEVEGNYSPRGVDSGLLNLLDGVQDTFKIPTFIMATTNYPQNLLSALANRPGRFDELIEMEGPSTEERLKLVEFMAQRSLTEDEIKSLSVTDAKHLSIAHLSEIVDRSELHDKSISQTTKEILAHMEKFNNGFEKKGSFGI